MKIGNILIAAACIGVLAFLITGKSCSLTGTSEELVSSVSPSWTKNLILLRSDAEGNHSWKELLSGDDAYRLSVIEIDNDYSDESLPEVYWVMHNSINELMQNSLNTFEDTPSFEDVYTLKNVDHRDNSYLEAWQAALQSGDCYGTGDEVIKFTITADLLINGVTYRNDANPFLENVSFGFQLFRNMPFEDAV